MSIEKNWLELIRPKKPVVEHGFDPSRRATLIAEPLERGFGLTLGNALRRVLLSSLQGAAITSVQIDGVVHEFSSIPGVREDVTDIVLNLKQVAIRMRGEGPKRVMLTKTGPGEVKASDIQVVSDMEVLNADHVICTLDDGASIRMELTVNNGKGYVPAEQNRPDDAPIGLIAIDSIYSPVRRVAYRVEHPRRSGARLRQADHRSRNQRLDPSGRRDRLRRTHPARPAAGVHHLRRAEAEERKAAKKTDLPFNPALLKVDELELSVRSPTA
ncbi:MAG: DNA-directed RNA polymerase subunit alpha [Hyphomonadaceae bacterium]